MGYPLVGVIVILRRCSPTGAPSVAATTRDDTPPKFKKELSITELSLFVIVKVAAFEHPAPLE